MIDSWQLVSRRNKPFLAGDTWMVSGEKSPKLILICYQQFQGDQSLRDCKELGWENGIKAARVEWLEWCSSGTLQEQTGGGYTVLMAPPGLLSFVLAFSCVAEHGLWECFDT